MKRTYCDRCGGEIPENAPNNVPRVVQVTGTGISGPVELCQKCGDELVVFLAPVK